MSSLRGNAAPVHPHMRGEYAISYSARAGWPRFTPTCVGNTAALHVAVMRADGSPPHAWGIPTWRVIGSSMPAGSPPHAWGILARSASQSSAVAVHPHMRGEYTGYPPSPCQRWRFTPTCVGNTLALSVRSCRCSGSPPHAWGIRSSCQTSALQLRFTPTCVGNTRDSAAECSLRRGSPPHAWGILSPISAMIRPCRFTPTCVGNTVHEPSIALPRARFTPTCVGNTETLRRLSSAIRGSPPHAWGIPRVRASCSHRSSRFTPTCVGNTDDGHRHSCQRRRFTPTCVGNTATPHVPLCQLAVHPHMRGEYALTARSCSAADAVHPHMRGEDSYQSVCTQLHLAVHPHMRGEYLKHHDRVLDVMHGSPPHAWGIPRVSAYAAGDVAVHPHMRGEDASEPIASCSVMRFTPTCVGKTLVLHAMLHSTRGSPPHAWGRRACDNLPRSDLTVHPHMRGED